MHSSQITQVFALDKIGYRIRKVLELIQQTRFTAYSLSARLQFYTSNLIELYHRDLVEQRKSVQQEDISLLHRAKEYIFAHYRDEGLKVDTIVKALSTSKTTLSRVFQQNNLTINAAIRTYPPYELQVC